MAEQDPGQWMAMMSEFEKEFSDAQEFSDWQPDPGEYNVIIKDVRTGITGTNSNDPAYHNKPYWAIKVEMLDGVDAEGNPLAGRSFEPFFFMGTPKRFGFFKGFARSLAGTSVASLQVADQIVQQSRGAVLRLKGTKNDRGTNWYVQSVVSRPEALQAQAAS